jgi:hypothetical protein
VKRWVSKKLVQVAAQEEHVPVVIDDVRLRGQSAVLLHTIGLEPAGSTNGNEVGYLTGFEVAGDAAGLIANLYRVASVGGAADKAYDNIDGSLNGGLRQRQ